MNKLLTLAQNYSRSILAILIILLISFIFFKIIDRLINPPISIVAEFIELGPLYKKMPVYYKGYKIGSTSKIKPSKDYKTTLVTITFYPDDLKLPENISAKVKKLNNGIDYINLEYPKVPSVNNLKTGSVIHGTTSLDIQSFMSAQVESGALGGITENAGTALSAITKAGDETTILIKTITALVNENRPAIKNAVNNLNLTTENIKNVSARLDNAITNDKMDNISADITSSIENIEKITNDVQLATENLNQTMDIVDSTLCELNSTAKNISSIAKDVKTSFDERAGILGILFGAKK